MARSRCIFIFILFLQTLFYVELNAQHQALNWYFGDKAGLTFDTCSTNLLKNSKMYAEEGTATISDSKGNLLFYTNGISIWNYQHQVIENGELPLHWITNYKYDSTTTSQAALIVPDPGLERQYYVFLTSPRTGNLSDGRFCYVKVDMTANDGAGKVLNPPICLADSITEKLTAVHHDNGKDIWVITQSFETAEIFAYLLTKEGIQDPVKSPTNKSYARTETRENATGQMKVSPDGKKLAYVFWEPSTTYFYQNYIGILDFNASTGKASNPAFINEKFMEEIFFGVEFSPNGNYLYASSNRKVLQYTISSGNSLTNRTVMYDYGEVYPYPSSRHGLQLAPNGHIYAANNSHLDAILYPNIGGKVATYVTFFQDLKAGTMAKVGLPNFIQSYFLNSSPPICNLYLKKFESCVPDTSVVSLVTPYPEQIDSVVWKTNTGTYPPSFHGLSMSIYLTTDWPVVRVSATVYFKDGNDTTLTTPLNVEKLTVQLPPDTTICLGDTLWIDTPDRGHYYLEKKTSTSAYQRIEVLGERWPITESGHYQLHQHFSNCYAFDYINVRVVEPPLPIDLGRDTIICRNSNYPYIYLNAAQPYSISQQSTYLWQDGSQNATSNRITQSGTYWVRVENECGWQSDTIHIAFENTLVVDLGEDLTLCEGEVVTLSVGDTADAWSWSTGSTEPSIDIHNAGTYWLEKWNTCGWVKDVIQVSYDRWIPLNLPDTVIACANETVTLDAGPYYTSYKWSTDEDSSMITAFQSGWYEVEVANACGIQRARTWVELVHPEETKITNVITPNGDGKNDFFHLHQTLEGSKLKVFNRWGKLLYQNNTYKNNWKGDGLSAGVYFYTLEHPCLTSPLHGQISIVKSIP